MESGRSSIRCGIYSTSCIELFDPASFVIENALCFGSRVSTLGRPLTVVKVFGNTDPASPLRLVCRYKKDFSYRTSIARVPNHAPDALVVDPAAAQYLFEKADVFTNGVYMLWLQLFHSLRHYVQAVRISDTALWVTDKVIKQLGVAQEIVSEVLPVDLQPYIHACGVNKDSEIDACLVSYTALSIIMNMDPALSGNEQMGKIINALTLDKTKFMDDYWWSLVPESGIA